MSLFPAYNNQSDNSSKDESIQQSSSSGYSWLNNSSFAHVEQSLLQETTKNASSREDETARHKIEEKIKPQSDVCKHESNKSDISSRKHRTKHKKHKKSKTEKSSRRNKQVRYLKRFEAKDLKALIKEDDEFYEDRRRELGNHSVDTLHRPAIPKYDCPRTYYSVKQTKRRAEKSRKGRYFHFDWGKVESENFFCGSRNEDSCDRNDSVITVKSEEEILERTSRFNKQLAEEPNNVDLWMQYIKFQDTTLKYQPVTASFSSARKKLAIADKKLAIVEKALSLNPLCEQLLKEKMHLAELVYPPGKLKQEALDMLNKDPTNGVLWRCVIHSSQYSLAQCTVPGTQLAYAQALERLHHARRGSTQESGARISTSMIELLFECMLFMRQAGLWEHLLTLIRLSLELNLAVPGSSTFNFNITIPEQQIRDLEDTILQSGLPMPAIWLRVERVRELCYWLPVLHAAANESDAIDPQRIVFANDVSNLLHPITDASLSLQSVVMTLVILKVPLLPMSDSAVRLLQLDRIPSAFDLVEQVLVAYYPAGLVQAEFEQYVSAVDGIPLPPNHKKALKAFSKGLLKKPEFRDDLCLYSEYALVERDVGNLDSALHVLQTASKLRKYMPDNAAYSQLHRNLVEILLRADPVNNRQKAVDQLCSLVSAPDVTSAADKFHHATIEVMLKLEKEGDICRKWRLEDVLRPHYSVEWTACHAYFLFLTHTVWVSAAFVEKTLERILPQARPATVGMYICEGLYEILIDILHFHCVQSLSSFAVLQKAAYKAHAIFPNNIHILHVMGLIENVTEASLLGMIVDKDLSWNAHTDRLANRISSSLFVLRNIVKGMYICEGLYEILIDILHFHCVQSLSSFAVLQKAAYKAHAIFPNNIHILHVMGLIETNAGGSAGSPWWKLTSVFTSSHSIFAKLFLIFICRARIARAQKLATIGSNQLIEASGGYQLIEASGSNQMRWLFNQLMSDDQLIRCPLFWRLCLQFSALHRDSDEIRKTFYKAVEECPWVKAIYMDAVQLLPENLQEIQDLLIEKELRLHSLLDELEILRTDAV
ncbi:uncharacterized protein LOC111046215 [Nilaparvata lugens]|uniref:uncharacterized protein LOC111046215 n=1 Tax=Nilaparvata lugens TaxID=108931 RepID=UPI00193D13BD|nr:uncharacterized protein LOC111046215 [Nilaparvata lugens]